MLRYSLPLLLLFLTIWNSSAFSRECYPGDDRENCSTTKSSASKQKDAQRHNDQSSLYGRIAAIRASDAQSAAELVSEGSILFALDQKKLNGPKYADESFKFSLMGEFRLAIRSGSKALYLARLIHRREGLGAEVSPIFMQTRLAVG